MTSYAGLDVSQQETQVCIVDGGGAVLWAGKARSEPEALAKLLRQRAPALERAVLESGALSALRRLLAPSPLEIGSFVC